MTHKLTIFGISGQTGRELAKSANINGWKVRGFVRATSRVEDIPDNCQIVRGTFEQPEQVVDAIADSDAVCCVIGPRPPYTDVFCASATKTIIAAMEQTGCRRIVCQTGAMIGRGPNRSFSMDWMAGYFAGKQPAAAKDREDQEGVVISSGLDWTIVKPPRLTNSQAIRRVQAGVMLKVGLLSRISRVNLAAFLLDELETGRFMCQRVFVKE